VPDWVWFDLALTRKIRLCKSGAQRSMSTRTDGFGLLAGATTSLPARTNSCSFESMAYGWL